MMMMMLMLHLTTTNASLCNATCRCLLNGHVTAPKIWASFTVSFACHLSHVTRHTSHVTGKFSFIDLAGSERASDTTDNDRQVQPACSPCSRCHAPSVTTHVTHICRLDSKARRSTRACWHSRSASGACGGSCCGVGTVCADGLLQGAGLRAPPHPLQGLKAH